MNPSLKAFKGEYQTLLLDFLWRQWSALGVAGQTRAEDDWIIDPEAKTVEALHLEKGTYQLVGRWHPGERAHSRLLKGFEVPVSALLDQP